MEQQVQNNAEQTELRAPLSASELMQNLVKAKKVMSVVESKKKAPNIIEDYDDENYDDEDITPNVQESFYYKNITEQQVKPHDPEKIKNSKLPDVIKTAMINHPIEQPSPLYESKFSDDFVKNARRLMEEENVTPKKRQSLPPRTTTNRVIQESHSQPSMDYNAAINMLKPIIENIIRESIDKIVDAKIDRLLKAQQYTTLNENLMIKVGDSVFKGNISGATKIKK